LFFFSSRRRHTRWPRDWSSDVCSSDLLDDVAAHAPKNRFAFLPRGKNRAEKFAKIARRKNLRKRIQKMAERYISVAGPRELAHRSEERRVGKECRCGEATDH